MKTYKVFFEDAVQFSIATQKLDLAKIPYSYKEQEEGAYLFLSAEGMLELGYSGEVGTLATDKDLAGALSFRSNQPSPAEPPKPKMTLKGCLGTLAFGFVALLFLGWLFTEPEPEPLTPEQQVVADSLAKVQARAAMIRQSFSVFDGSHDNLTKYIKANLNDPDSYDHIGTQSWDMKDHVVIRTQYTAKNAFGGKVRQSVFAKAKLNGELIEVEFE